jgi:hypothetical protein
LRIALSYHGLDVAQILILTGGCVVYLLAGRSLAEKMAVCSYTDKDWEGDEQICTDQPVR